MDQETALDWIDEHVLQRPATYAPASDDARTPCPALQQLGWTAYAALPPVTPRSRYERSRWVRRESDGRCTLELWLLAYVAREALHEDQVPFWKDGDWDNAVPDNVSTYALSRGRSRSRYGVRSNTPEYWKRYYAVPENRARVRRQTRESARRMRELLKAARAVLQQDGDAESKIDELRARLLGGEPDATACPRCGNEIVAQDAPCEWCGWSAAGV
jgi:hypothetical protein